MLNMKRQQVLYLLLAMSALITINATMLTLRSADRLRLRFDEPIQPWMNVSYIAHAYDVPPAVISSAIGIDDRRRGGPPIRTIARQQGVPLSTLVEQIMRAIEKVRTAPLASRDPLP